MALSVKAPPKSSSSVAAISECRRRYLIAKIMDSLQFYPDLLEDDELEEVWIRAQSIEQCAYSQAAASDNNNFNREEYCRLIRSRSSLVFPAMESGHHKKMVPIVVQMGSEQQAQDNVDVAKSEPKDESKPPTSGKIFQKIRGQVQKFWFSGTKESGTEDQQWPLEQKLIDCDIVSNYSNNSFALTDDEPLISFNNIAQDPKQQKHLQRQLILILHAHKCKEKERSSPFKFICLLPYCPKMKAVLDHMITCREGPDCSYHHCHTSRQIIAHWKECNNNEKCSICLPVKNSKSVKAKEQSRGNSISPFSSILKKYPRRNEKEEKGLKELKNTMSEHLAAWEAKPNEGTAPEKDGALKKQEEKADEQEGNENTKAFTNNNNNNSLCLRKSPEMPFTKLATLIDRISLMPLMPKIHKDH